MNHTILLATLLAVFCAPAMERKRSVQESQTPTKRTKYQDLSTLEKFPRELQIKIIADTISASATARDAFNELNKIKLLSTHFHNLLKSQEAVKAIIHAVAKRFYHNDGIKAAQFWNTPEAREWIQSALPPLVQEKIAKVMHDKIIAIINGNFEPIKNELNAAYKTGTVKDIFGHDYTKIWLLTFIMQATSGLRKFTLQELADALFPQEKRSAELNEWLKFAESALLERLPNSLAYSTPDHIQQIQRQGIDITINLRDHFPALFYAVDLDVIELLLQAGASINEQDRLYGHTSLHYLILYELQKNAEKNQRVYSAIEKLLQSGANPNIKNAEGKTVLDLVRVKQSNLSKSGSAQDPFLERLIALLKRYGAR